MKKILCFGSLFLVFALSPLWAFDDVRGLAHQIDLLASHVHEQAEDAAHHGGWEEKTELRDLHALAEEARHFHEQIETWYQDPRHTYQDYLDLVQAQDQARRSFYWLRTFAHIRYDFDRLGSLIQQLRAYYDDNGGGQGGDIRNLAHQVDMTAERVHLWAEDSAHHGTWLEQQALQDLHVLASQARHYHEQIEGWYQDPRHTYND